MTEAPDPVVPHAQEAVEQHQATVGNQHHNQTENLVDFKVLLEKHP